MIHSMYRSARHAGYSPRRAVTMIGQALGIPATDVKRQLGLR